MANNASFSAFGISNSTQSSHHNNNSNTSDNNSNQNFRSNGFGFLFNNLGLRQDNNSNSTRTNSNNQNSLPISLNLNNNATTTNNNNTTTTQNNIQNTTQAANSNQHINNNHSSSIIDRAVIPNAQLNNLNNLLVSYHDSNQRTQSNLDMMDSNSNNNITSNSINSNRTANLPVDTNNINNNTVTTTNINLNSNISNQTNANSSSSGTSSNNNTNTNANNNSGDNQNAILRNLRHYVYAADQPNPDELLNLDLNSSQRLPAPLTEQELRLKKDKNGLYSIRLTPFIDTSNANSSQGLFFDPILRTAGPGSQLVVGRYTERVREAICKLPEQYHPVVFKSKVISRAHGCFKVDSQGNWFVKDVKSSSGTFLNHQRLSPASTMSKDFLLHDGDILQLGMDFRGGTEEIYKCVRMKIELNKSWKRKANAFNKEALQRIKNLQKVFNNGIEEEDCSICLSKIKPCQAIFISPCSHNWHFHCIRRLVMLSYPQFVCPNCRSTCDLEANLESSDEESDLDELNTESIGKDNDTNDDDQDTDNEMHNDIDHEMLDDN